jgi:hypothetical protein
MNSPARGMLTTITGGVPGAAVRVNGTEELFEGACPTATSCIAVGARAHVTMGVVVDTPV